MLDPISIILSALVLGAAAGLKPTAEQAVKDAYQGLKVFIQQRYARVSVEVLESDPESKERQNIIKEDLQKAEAEKDKELLDKAQNFIELAKALMPETSTMILAKLGSESQVSGSYFAGRDVTHQESRSAGRDYYEARDRAIINVGSRSSGENILQTIDTLKASIDELDIPSLSKKKAKHEIDGARIEAEEGSINKEAIASYLRAAEAIVKNTSQQMVETTVFGKFLKQAFDWLRE